MAITAGSIFNRFSTTLQDETRVRWTQNEFLAWLNTAQRVIASIRPDASLSHISMALVAGAKQSVPSNALSLTNITRNMGTDGDTPGRTVMPLPKDILDRSVPYWQTLTDEEVSFFCYNPKDPKVFWIYPAQPNPPVQYLEVVAAVVPDELVALSDAITVNEDYEEPLLDYCLYRALSKDAEDATQLQRATHYQTSFLQAVGLNAQADMAVPPEGGQ